MRGREKEGGRVRGREKEGERVRGREKEKERGEGRDKRGSLPPSHSLREMGRRREERKGGYKREGRKIEEAELIKGGVWYYDIVVTITDDIRVMGSLVHAVFV